jgi:hypothetical protein
MTAVKDGVGADRLGPDGDDVYAALMAAHEGLSFEESARLNARLVLLLANEVGDIGRFRAILAAATPQP